MKYLVLLISMICLAFGDEDTEMMKLIKKCSADGNGSDIDRLLEDYYNFKLPENDSDYCLLGCLLTESGIIHDGKFDIEMSVEGNKDVYEPESLEKANEIDRKCVEEIGETVDVGVCQFTKKYVMCTVNEGKKANLKVMENKQ